MSNNTYNAPATCDLSKFRPMLAASIDTAEEIVNLTYPVIVSPKIDGIRVLIHPIKGAVTRSLKPLPNTALRAAFGKRLEQFPLAFSHLDGEITFGQPEDISDKTIFNKTTSAIRCFDGHPDAVFWIFDSFRHPLFPYTERVRDIFDYSEESTGEGSKLRFRFLESQMVDNYAQLLRVEQEYLDKGFEGIMVRSPYGTYKFGRSTLNQGNLLKLKRFADCEAVVIGFEELMRNDNPLEQDAFGLADRSSSKANLRASGVMGALIVEAINGPFIGKRFNVGTGFTFADRKAIWESQDKYLGRDITIVYQMLGSIDAPRFPVYKGFRDAE